MSEGSSFSSNPGNGETDISNTPGSTAGAGSGDFHQYRMQRRKENFRVARLEGEARKEREVKNFEERLETRQKEAEERTSKKAEKRKKKKQTKLHAKIRKKWEAAIVEVKQGDKPGDEKKEGKTEEAAEEEGIVLKKETKATDGNGTNATTSKEDEKK